MPGKVWGMVRGRCGGGVGRCGGLCRGWHREVQGRYGGGAGMMRERCGGGAGEVQGRCGEVEGRCGEVWGRCKGGAGDGLGEVWGRCRGGAGMVGTHPLTLIFFMQFLARKWLIIGFHSGVGTPRWEILDLPLEGFLQTTVNHCNLLIKI